MRIIKTLTFALLICATGASAQNHPDCGSQAVRDSLFGVYSEKAENYPIEHPSRVQIFDSLISICPNISEAYQEKAFSFIATKNFEKLFENIDKAVELEPNRWLPYRGYLHCILAKNYDKAIADFEVAEQMMPHAFTMDHTFSFFIAMAYLQSGDFEKAEVYFQKDMATQRRGEGRNDIHYNTLLYSGIAYYLGNELDKAQARFSECLQQYEQHPTANYYMGLVLKVTGDKQYQVYFQKSRQYLEDGYKINEPNSHFVPYPRQVTLADLDAN
ncbi:tetratricopeptide repeat protein [Dyadobacter sp. CY343]|uniref:tetratricopeptide repeat protein n=1 Tax=Dyadobacter sp. CY343 TaxID=2907299 RepID=UPI001F26C062|nr:tetratricopeptide repeat protein [Dyadobacter sp. CY343]MCE7062013.1 tetratricopeptide repeat protein [Dyadobacter sp. CY343]